MIWDFEIAKPLLFRLLGYLYSMVLSDFFYKCSVELFHEFKNITLGSMKLYVIGSLLQHKLDNMLRIMFIVAVSFGLIVVPQLRRIVFTELDFLMVFFAVIILMVISSISKHFGLEDAYKYFIRKSGLDCGSFMAYSFYHGYIKYVVSPSGDISSKGLVERMNDYEAKHQVKFPIKKLLILQPQSMFIPPTLVTDQLQNADNLEEVKINRGGVVERSYQLSVYKIVGPGWYVNVQGASPLLTYLEESKRSQLLDKYKTDVAHSFRKHLETLIRDDLRCRGLVEVIYYNDLDEHGERIDVGVVLKNHIEESLKKKALNGQT